MDDKAVSQFDALLGRCETFHLVTHVNPDADGLGSAIAMSRYLRRLGKKAQLLITAPLPRRLSFLAREGELSLVDGSWRPERGDAFMIFDVSTLGRLGVLEPHLREGYPIVLFDHHDGDVEFECIAFIEEDAGATAQLVHDLLTARGVALDIDLATPLYVGLISDTGSFNFGKTSPHSHRIAARLLEAGVKPLEIHGLLEGTKSLGAVRVVGAVMSSIKLDEIEPRIAHATLAHELWTEGGAEALDIVSLVNQTIALEGVRAGVLFMHIAPNTVRLSFRSKGDTSIVEAAQSFGGGGHRNASGATVVGTPDTLREPVLARLREVLAQE